MDQSERRRIERLLWSWGTALQDCERRRAEMRRLTKQAEDAECVLRAQALTGMPSGGGVGDPTASAVQMRDDAMQRVKALADEINAIMARKAQMDAIIGMLPEREQELLTMRYVRRMHISLEIPRKVHASKRTVHYWMSDALEKIAPFCTKFGVQ